MSTAAAGFWSKSHHLDRMTLRELAVAYAQYPAILAYGGCALGGVAGWAWRPASALQTLAAIGAAVLLYPLVWYALHRFVLHSRWMWKHDALAPTWKRIHFDHHQDPNHLEVLFGALNTTLPTIVIATAPVGFAIGGVGGACAALATGMITTCVYEFCHCIQHLAYKPRNRWLAAIKARHMAHHFHDETGNFGITNYGWDRLFGTFYARVADRPKSATVHNLGYTEAVAARYPRVRELTVAINYSNRARLRENA